MSEPYRVMTVCTGNICRSPMAEVVLRDRLEAAGLADRVVVDSTGVSDEESGNPIDRRARAVLTAHGYAVDGTHRARQVSARDVVERDLVLAMTTQHARALRRLAHGGVAGSAGRAADDDVPQVTMFRSFDPAAPRVGAGGDERVLDVADPWYGGTQDFEDCLAQVEAAADGIVAHVRAALSSPR
ncbi:low molecular weight phosphotyrosine protein phosphatase [Cellulosimicrobium terreum]|nr:low molecular weight phosphotyrosine protein phosphatase [Cellulosimicrobium terreum]